MGLTYIAGIHTSLSAIEKDKAFVNDAAQRLPGIEKTLHKSVRALFVAVKLVRYVMAEETGGG